MAKNTATPREYTMPNKYEGGYSTYNPSADRMANAELIGNDIASLKAKRELLQKELDELKIKLQNFDLLSVNVPELTDEDKENIQAQQFRAGAEAMMEYDPATAQSWLLRADEIEARKQNRTAGKSPEAIRLQLRIARDKATEIINSPSEMVDATTRQLAFKERALLSEEMANAYPNDQEVYSKINALYSGTSGQKEPPPTTSDEYTALSSEIATTIGNIKYNGSDLDKANASLVQKINASGLSPRDKESLKEELNIAVSNKGGAPKATDVDKEVDKMFAGASTQPIPSAYGRYDNSYNAYNAAKSSFDSGAIGASIGNFLYSLRPEAVHEGDIELAKNSVRDGNQQALKTVLDKVGMGGLLTTDYKTLATQLGRAAYNKLINDRKANTDQIVALMDKLNPEQVRKRALTYYKLPNKMTGSGGGNAGTSETPKPANEGATKGGYKKINGVWVKQ